MKKRMIALAMACTLTVGCAIGGTLAWLVADTGTVTNTFTIGDVKIDLEETGATELSKNYDFVPGDKLAKDPHVTVQAISEPCYVFIKVTEANMIPVQNSNNDIVDALDYSINTDVWTELSVTEAASGVTYYYKELTEKTTQNTTYYILNGEGDSEYKNGVVTVSEYVTKDNVKTLTDNKPTLAFDAAAIQSANVGGLSGAWSKLDADFIGSAILVSTDNGSEEDA